MAFKKSYTAEDSPAIIGDTIEGIVKRQLNFDSGFAIFTVVSEENDFHEYKLKGMVQHIPDGMRIRAIVKPARSEKYGLQYDILNIEELGFDNEPGLIKFLSGDTFKDIGTVFASKIVDHLGINALDVIDQNPEKVYEVPGLPEWRAKSLIDGWLSKRAYNRVLGELVKWGLTKNQAEKAYKHFGEDILNVLKRDFYALTEIFGVTFSAVDKIALKNGVDRKSVNRICAALLYCLDKSSQSGHCYLSRPDLINVAARILNENEMIMIVDNAEIGHGISALMKLKRVVQTEDDKVCLPELYYAEEYIAEKLSKMVAGTSSNFRYSTVENMISDMSANNIAEGINFAPEQLGAIMNAFNSRVSIMTGGPGTGKTTVSKTLCDLLTSHNLTYLLCAPTGRAAKRLSEATGDAAKTIHRLLEYNPQMGFLRNDSNPLFADCIIVDEMSMIDVSLMQSLLQAVDFGTRLVMIGDANQLPSVGPGNVLRDLINSGKIPFVELKKIFRQTDGSDITLAAHDILRGVSPVLPSPGQAFGKKCMLVSVKDTELAKQYILQLATRALPDAGVKSSDIQILTPMREDGLGVKDLNPLLQQAFNPPSTDKQEVTDDSKRIFRVGDKVMQTRNDYDKNVFNGDIGVLNRFYTTDQNERFLYVDFPDIGEVSYPYTQWDNLMHAWASTIHRSQGSEYNTVILVLHPSQPYMLARNLFYTGLTRAKYMCIIIGTPDSLAIAVRNNKEALRNTNLKSLLKMHYD